LSEIVSVLQDSENMLQSPREYMVEVNEKFHDAIIAASGNRRLAKLIRQNRLYYFNYRLAALYSDEEVATSRAQHEQIVRALLDRDPQAAEELTRKHVEGALALVLAKIS
jgi:DNA-binding GntR family transcriptional regulator